MTGHRAVDIKGFILRFFAIIGLLLTFWMGMGLYWLMQWEIPSVQEPEQPKSMVLELDLTRPLIEEQKSFSLDIPTLLAPSDETPYFTIVRALNRAKEDPSVKGVVARLGHVSPSLVHTQELAEALRKFRESGKFTYIFAPSYGDFGQGSTSYILASQFETIWLQPIGSVGLMGLSIEAPFVRSALQQWGVEADIVRREEYKSVMENVTRDDFSPAVKANMESMISSLSDQMAQGLSLGRKIDLAQAKKLIEDGPYTAQESLKAGLVSKIGYEDEMDKEIEGKAGADAERVGPKTYLYFASKKDKIEPKADVALIYADGLISDRPAEGPYRVAESDVIDTDTVVGAFQDAVDNKDIKAILFRVNSPGGSPVASETMRRALVRAKEAKKPVIVSMGRVAASGGYWIAMNADHIVADPATITGSIGVVSGKMVLGGLYDKLGVKWDGISTSETSTMWSTRAPFSAKARERVNAMIDETYKAFTDNVAAARHIAPEKIPDVAKGRVFTGEQAIKVGLVDELGGMETAIAAVKTKLKLQPTDRIVLVQVPEPETPQTIVRKLLKNLKLTGTMMQDFLSTWMKISARLKPLSTAMEFEGGIVSRIPLSNWP